MSTEVTPSGQSGSPSAFHVILSVLIIEALLMAATGLVCANRGVCSLGDYSSDLFVAGICAIGLASFLEAGGGGVPPDPDYAGFWGKPLPLPVDIDIRPNTPYLFGIFITAAIIAGLLAIVLSIL
jgi:hypothetical protein